MRFASTFWPLTVGALVLAGCAQPLHTGAAQGGPACANRVYVANSYANTLSVIDTGSNTVVATIPMEVPYNPIISADGAKVYVTNGPAGTISVIDARTNAIAQTLRPGAHATGLDFTPDGKRLLVTLGGETIEHRGHVRVIDLATGAMSPMIEVGRTPERITASPDGKHAYVVSRDKQLFVVDIDRLRVVGTIPLIGNTFNVIAAPRGDKLYLVFRSDHVVGVINTASSQVERYIPVGKGPIGLDFSVDGRTLFVTNGQDNLLTEISVSDNTVVRTARIGDKPGLLRLSNDGRFAYIAYSSAKHVGVVDLHTRKEVANVTTGSPTSLAVCRSR